MQEESIENEMETVIPHHRTRTALGQRRIGRRRITAFHPIVSIDVGAFQRL